MNENLNIKKHYDSLASNYDDYWIYSEEFIQFLSEKIVEILDFKRHDQFLDLGCGTGIFSKKILSLTELDKKITCVDSSKKMLSKLSDNNIDLINTDAITFFSEYPKFDKILIKEVLHHIPEKNDLFEKIFNSINSNGILLILLLPPKIEYPLFNEALEEYEAAQPHYKEISNKLNEIGFEVKIKIIDYDIEIEAEKYYEMVKNRYLSILSVFNDAEIENGLVFMKKKYKNIDVLKFKEHFVFIQAVKKSDW